jgi:hypothetical protein
MSAFLLRQWSQMSHNLSNMVRAAHGCVWRVKGLLQRCPLYRSRYTCHCKKCQKSPSFCSRATKRDGRACCALLHSCFSQLRTRFRRTIQPRSFLVLNCKRMDDWGVFPLLISRVCSNKGQPHVTPRQANLCIVLLRPSKAQVEEPELL